MKTLSVEIERRQTLSFFVSVPDHWSRIQSRLALTKAVINEIVEDTMILTGNLTALILMQRRSTKLPTPIKSTTPFPTNQPHPIPINSPCLPWRPPCET